MTTVVKIGGSLFPEYIDDLCHVFEKVDEKIVLINGGGELANKIREYDTKYSYGSDANHWSAIKCMDTLAILIATHSDKIKTITSIDEIAQVHLEDKIPLLMTYNILNQIDPLPHSWNVTSDSISAWLAGEINASKLLILTDINGIYDGNFYSKKEGLIKQISPNELLFFNETCVDKCLPTILLKNKVDCFIINGKKPQLVYKFLKNDYTINDKYTHIGDIKQWKK